MFRNTSPGRLRPGLIIFVLLLITAAGCGVRQKSFTEHPPSAVAPRQTESAPAETGKTTLKEPGKQQEADLPKKEEKAQEDKSDQHKEPPVTVTVTEPKQESTTEEAGKESPPALSVPDNAGPPKLDVNAMKVELKQGSRDSSMIALTFDAGASPKPTPSILATLKRYGVHSTFFLTGRWMESNPGLTKEIAEAGHEIGNHSYSHPDFTKLDDAGIREQLEKTEQIARDVAGVSTKPFFRPPYGARNARVRSVAAEEGYRSVFWSADSWDAYKKGITPNEIKERVLSRAKGGSIVLMHCGSAATAEALPSIIEELHKRGYRLVTVSELAGSGAGS